MENVLDIFRNFAFKKGYKIQSLQEGRMSFEMGVWSLLFVYDYSKDSNFFQILLPNIDEIDICQDFQKISKMQSMNMCYKVGKIYIQGNAVHLSVEQFIYSVDDVERMFNRILKILQDMYMDYYYAFSNFAKSKGNEASK